MSARCLASLVALAATLVAGASTARAEVERYALVIGNDDGDGDDGALRYAERDAERVHDVLRRLGGFAAENVVLLRGEDAAAARRALIRLNGRIRREGDGARPAAMLFVYYSGHADAASLHLGRTRFDLRELEELVEGSSAAFRVLVLDACRSGALTRVKGGLQGPAMAIALRERLAGEGTVFLTATSANEDAQESDEIQGSFFTHYLVSGLLGAADVNGDGRVVLEEAYRHAYERTLRASSRTLAGTQHPTYRYDLRGQGQIVLTRPVGGARALVDFPRGRTYLLFRDDVDGAVVAEVGSRDAVRRLSVEAGRYFVRARAERYLLEGDVALAPGGPRRIQDDALTRIDYARFVRKGAGDVRAVHGPLVGLGARAALFEAGACLGPYAGYAVEAREVTLMARLGLCEAAALRDGAGGREIGAEVRVSREWDGRWWTLGVGLAPGVALLSDSSAVEGAVAGGYRAVAMLGTTLAATIELPGSLYAIVEVGAETYVQRRRMLVFEAGATSQEAPRDRQDSLDADAVLRSGLGVGVRW